MKKMINEEIANMKFDSIKDEYGKKIKFAETMERVWIIMFAVVAIPALLVAFWLPILGSVLFFGPVIAWCYCDSMSRKYRREMERKFKKNGFRLIPYYGWVFENED